MEYKHKKKILIFGIGSSGKTALLYLFHHLGFNIGFKEGTIDKVQGSKADTRILCGRYSGLEYFRDRDTRKHLRNMRKRGADDSPRVLKQTVVPTPLWKAFEEGSELGWELEHLIVCVRDPEELYRSWMGRNESVEHVEKKKKRVFDQFYRRLITASNLTPSPRVTLIEFPRFAQDWEYCYWKLDPMLNFMMLEEFKEAWDKAIIPERVDWV